MIKKLFSSQLRLNMVSGIATTVVNSIVMAVSYPVYLYFLGYERYGVWLVLSTILTLVRLGNLGLGQAVTKLVAEDYSCGDIEGVRHYVLTALTLLCISGTGILIVVLVLKNQIIAAFNIEDENAKIALALLPYLGALSIYVFIVQVFSGTLSGLGRMDLVNYIQSLTRIVHVCVAVTLLLRGFGMVSLLIGTTFSYLFNHLATFVCIRRIIPLQLLRISNIDFQRCRRLLRFGSGVFGSSLVNLPLHPFNRLMLSRYVGLSSVTIYEMALIGSIQVKCLAEIGFRALMPEVSRLGKNMTREAKDRISRIYHRSMKLLFLWGLPMHGGLIILITPLLKIWLRQRFVDELPCPFRIMFITAFISLLGIPAYNVLLGLGMVRNIFVSHVILSGINVLVVIAMVILWHSVSVEKVCWAMLTAATIATAYLTWQNRRRVLRT